jgi:hypothetical protein
VKFQTIVIGAPVGCGYIIPKLAIPFTTLSMHLRISESFSSRFIVMSATPRGKNSRRIKGVRAIDVSKQLSQLKCRLDE